MKISDEAYEDFLSFISGTLLPLMGLKSDRNDFVRLGDHDEVPAPAQRNTICFLDNHLYFGNSKKFYCSIPLTYLPTDDVLSLAEAVLLSFFQVCEFNYQTSGKSNRYLSKFQKEATYQYAVQKAICRICFGQDSENVDSLFDALEMWSQKTYEGHKVPFGFVIDSTIDGEKDCDYGSFIDFLNDDYSATLSDCIDSVMLLDRNCSFLKYLSITETGKFKTCSLINQLPIRFNQTIAQYVIGQRVGVFLLTNGDIIISKNQAIAFVKRNRKWLNFSYNAFETMVTSYLRRFQVSKDLLPAIFASAVDVSFSHSGGIISVVESQKSVTEKGDKGEEPILHFCDCIANGLSLAKTKEAFEQKNEDFKKANKPNSCIGEADIKKRLLKRKMITDLVGTSSFQKLDRRLRSDLIGLDGACILDRKGTPCAFGAIIQNDSGSSGGGRGAAAKKLSKVGMALKISADGYIELYIDDTLRYAIK
jgi:hypothetical protein